MTKVNSCYFKGNDIYSTSGSYIAYKRDQHIYSVSGEYIYFIANNNFIFNTDGNCCYWFTTDGFIYEV